MPTTSVNGPSVARLRAMHPLPVPTSATRPVRTRARTSSTSPSVSGRGISARRSHPELEVAEAGPARHVGQRLAGGAPADGRGEGVGPLPRDGRRRAGPGPSRALPAELGPEPERLAPRRADARRGERRGALGEQRPARRRPASDAILLLPAGHPQRLDHSSRWPSSTSARLCTERLIRWSVTRLWGKL